MGYSVLGQCKLGHAQKKMAAGLSSFMVNFQLELAGVLSGAVSCWWVLKICVVEGTCVSTDSLRSRSDDDDVPLKTEHTRSRDQQ